MRETRARPRLVPAAVRGRQERWTKCVSYARSVCAVRGLRLIVIRRSANATTFVHPVRCSLVKETKTARGSVKFAREARTTRHNSTRQDTTGRCVVATHEHERDQSVASFRRAADHRCAPLQYGLTDPGFLHSYETLLIVQFERQWPSSPSSRHCTIPHGRRSKKVVAFGCSIVAVSVFRLQIISYLQRILA